MHAELYHSIIHVAAELFIIKKEHDFLRTEAVSGRHQFKGAARGCDVSYRTFTNIQLTAFDSKSSASGDRLSISFL